MRPVIGIGCDVASAPTAAAHLRLEYADAVSDAGGLVVLLPPYRSPEEARQALSRLDGLVLSGGPDYDPGLYGQEPHGTTCLAHPRRQQGDLLLAREALGGSLPLLGICGGLQVINIALGGDLIQDIPSAVPGSRAHRGPSPEGPAAAPHRVLVKRGTLLERLVGGGELLVNTSHHQAVGRPGRGLVVSARAEDEVVEAIESSGGPLAPRFLLAVQWHPERDPAPFNGAIFQGLIEAARRARGEERR